MSDVPGYLHGYTDEEAQRLLDQAEFLAPWVFDGVHLDGVHTLLEVGLGVGAETRLLRARWPGLCVIGCDISDGQLAHARRVLAADIAAGAVELMRASATALPLPAATADAGFVCWLLEHVDDPAGVMREVARVVRPGGRIFVTEVYNHSLTIEPTQPADRALLVGGERDAAAGRRPPQHRRPPGRAGRRSGARGGVAPLRAGAGRRPRSARGARPSCATSAP